MHLFNDAGCLNQSLLYKTEAGENRVGYKTREGEGEREKERSRFRE